MAFARGINFFDVKVKWAEIRLKEFQSLASEHVSRPYRITEHDDVVNQLHVRQIHLRPTNYRIAILLGEFAYALRSGLDQLAWQLALLATQTPYRRTQFPIHESADPDSERIFMRQLQDVLPDAINVIRDLQPHNRGAAFRDDPLWQLSELCDLDKHRIFPGRSSDLAAFIVPTGYRRHDIHNDSESLVEFVWPLSMKQQVILRPYIADLVFGEPIDASGATFEITRSEIAEIFRYVRDEVRPGFVRFFPKAAIPKP